MRIGPTQSVTRFCLSLSLVLVRRDTVSSGVSNNLVALSVAVSEQLLYERASSETIFKYTKDLTQSCLRKSARLEAQGLPDLTVRLYRAKQMFPTAFRLSLLPWWSSFPVDLFKECIACFFWYWGSSSSLLVSSSSKTHEEEEKKKKKKKPTVLGVTHRLVKSTARKVVCRTCACVTGAVVVASVAFWREDPPRWTLFMGSLFGDFIVGSIACHQLGL